MNKRWAIIACALGLSGALVVAQGARSPEALFKAAQHTEEVQGDLKAAIEQYKKVVAGGNRSLVAQALLRMAECHQKLGDQESRKIYEQLVRDFADQNDAAATARRRLEALGTEVASSAKLARQAWSGHGVDTSGSISADGRYFSFTDWDTGDIAVRDLVLGTSRRLSNTGGWVGSGDYAEESTVSQDGRQVLYGWFLEKEHKNELRLISTTASAGTVPRTILRTERPDYIVPLGWLPDGNHIVVLRTLEDRTNQIGTLDTQSGAYRSIKSLEWRYPTKASVSPDGRFLAYDVPAAENGSPRDIMLLATDGSREVPLVRGPANDLAPIWSPDGSQVLFLSERTGNTSLWAIAIHDDRGDEVPTLVKSDIGNVALIGIARNGTLYYGVTGRTRQNIYIAEIDSAGRAGVPAPATENFVGTNSGPSWSRDGQFLAYYSARNPTVVVVKSLATGVDRIIPVPRGLSVPFATGPKWFPDGLGLLIQVRDAEGAGVSFVRLSLETQRTEALWHLAPPLCSSYDLSPDGTSIFCAIQNSGKAQDSEVASGRLLRYDIAQHREVELRKGEWFISLAVSPDGKQLAYLKSIRENTVEYPSALNVIPAAGGEPREVYRDPIWLGGSRYNALTWAADQQSLFFVKEGNGDGNILWRVPLTGGRRQPVGIVLQSRIKSPASHPDGKRIAFATSEQDDNEIWTLENFLPRLAAKK